MWLVLSCLAIFVALIYSWLTWNLEYWRKRSIPGPRGLPLMGSFPKSLMQTLNMVYEVEVEYRKYRHQTPYFGFFLSRKPALMITDPNIVKQVLITNFTNFHDNSVPIRVDKNTDPLFGRNPFMLEGEEWKEKRSEVTPAFTNIRLKNMYPIMQHVAKTMTTYLRSQLENKPDGIDLKDLGSRFTADAVANSIFGVDGKALSGEHSEILAMGSSIFKNTIPFIIYLAVVQFIPDIERFWAMGFISKPVERFFEKLTREAVQMRANKSITREDFLNYLIGLQQKKKLTDIDMAAHAMTFFLDGYESSSLVIANTVYQLTRNPEIQEKLRTEINSAVATGESISYEQILDLEYLEQVINESLRISPVVGFAAKVCTENITFTDNKDHQLEIEKGMTVHIPSYSIHHDEQHYPNPETFDPDRFSAETGGLKAYKDKGVFLAFGDGPRICLGMKYGTLQVKVAIVELIRNFILKPNAKTLSPDVYDPTSFMLTKMGGLWADFEPIVY